MPKPILENLRNRRVLVTGHTGFKGAWLVKWLRRLENVIAGYALPPETHPSHFEVGRVAEDLEANIFADIRDERKLAATIADFHPHLIIHFAAQSIVSRAFSEPRETFEINVMGTVNVLEAVRKWKQPCAVLCVTSDKCYENIDQVWGYRECDPLGEKEPYGGSKGAAELAIRSYRHSYFPSDRLAEHQVWLAAARAGNVIGGGDWTTDALLVDVFQALAEQRVIELRNPQAIRPWQHVLDCLGGYLEIANQLLGHNPVACDAWNIGPLPGNDWTVQQVVEQVIEHWKAGQWRVQPTPRPHHEAATLRLTIEKAIRELSWQPLWDVSTAIRKTVDWYRVYWNHPDQIPNFTESQLDEYEQLWHQRKADSIGSPIS